MGTILYIPHGGGPLPLMGDPGHQDLNAFLSAIPDALPRPRAVMVVSAHWERDIPVVTSHEQPGLIYDYSGFPRQTYEIQYPAPGDPALAAKTVDLLTAAGIKARTDDRRGFDHGVFIPLSLMLPHADIPCIQISLCADLDPLSHLKTGEALAPLMAEDVLLLGSGFSFHNMGAFGRAGGTGDQTRDPDEDNQAFQDWLKETCAGPGTSPQRQKENLIRWETAPGAQHCHPREEHLLPLMVCAGAAGYRPGETVFDGTVMERRALSFLWREYPPGHAPEMRIWDIDPGFLNDKSLLGEHRELHGLFSIHVNGKKGYASHPETLRWKTALSGLLVRHDLLVSEMQLRGFTHKSPLDPPSEKTPHWPDAFIDTPGAQFTLLREKYRDKASGRIPLPKEPAGLWAAHKYSVMARDPERYRAIGPGVAKKSIDFNALCLTLVEVLRQAPPPGRLVNALDHMWGYVSDHSPAQRDSLSPQALLAEIRTRAKQQKITYLLRSTALGELGYWVSRNNFSA